MLREIKQPEELANDNIRYVDISEAELAMEETDKAFMDNFGAKPKVGSETLHIPVSELQTETQRFDLVQHLIGAYR